MASNKFIDKLLHVPSYGWTDANGALVVPTKQQLWREAFSRINIFKTRKNWISLASCVLIAGLSVLFLLFLFRYFSWYLVPVVVVYSMVIMGTHGTIWYHRYGTHKSYTFSHPLWRLLTQHLVIKTIPEEIYVVSHHVHHSKSDLPGDPYNPEAGLLYCMLAEFNHQRISPNLNPEEYQKVQHFMRHTGVRLNTYEEYQQWGSVTNPWYALGATALNWTFWYFAFFFIGGHALACAVFSAALLWFILVRAFNYTGHGGGEAKHRDGVDFDRSNLSLNQARPGLLAGEWHNNHHLYPGSARAGFLPRQLDLAWLYIIGLYKLGMVSSFRDSKKEFLRKFAPNGHARDMEPLTGESYRKEHLDKIV